MDDRVHALANDPHALPGCLTISGRASPAAASAVDGVAIHAVTGGNGPALLLISGWPQTWYVWRFLMPSLAEHFTVVARSREGSVFSEKVDGAYDTATHAADFAGSCQSLAISGLRWWGMISACGPVMRWRRTSRTGRASGGS